MKLPDYKTRILDVPTRFAVVGALLFVGLGGGAALTSHNTAATVIATDVTPSPSPTDTPTPSDTPADTPTATATPTDIPAPTAAPTPEDAHGQAVAAAAHTCARGPHGVHGHCVSAVAQESLAAQSPDNGETESPSPTP